MTRLDATRHARRGARRRSRRREPRPSGVRPVRGRRSRQNFYTWGSMGLASSIGLGLAMAQPERRVVVLDGDGSLLMNLGSLATIGWVKPANLVVIVWDNGLYGTTGGQDTATAHGADLEAAARAMGIAATATVRTPSELDAAMARTRGGGGAVGDRREGRRVRADREAAAGLRVHQAALHGGDRRSRRVATCRAGVTASCRASAAPRLARFVVAADAAADARERAAAAVLDTIGVTLAGVAEPAARIVRDASIARRRTAAASSGARPRARPRRRRARQRHRRARARLRRHVLRVARASERAARAGGARRRRSWSARPAAPLLDAYIVGFEIEARLGRVMNPRHYQRGWHCTSTLGTIGAAAAAQPAARARRGRRPRTRWRSPRPKRPASRRTSARW